MPRHEPILVDAPPNGEELLEAEPDLLRGLLNAASQLHNETRTIQIKRHDTDAKSDRVFFTFRIHPLSEKDYDWCRDQCTQYVRNRRLGGVKVPEDTDTVAYRALLIYTATVDEDKKALWDNKRAWDLLNVISGPDCVEAALKAGEKNAVIDQIDDLSGYGAEVEETAKN